MARHTYSISILPYDAAACSGVYLALSALVGFAPGSSARTSLGHPARRPTVVLHEEAHTLNVAVARGDPYIGTVGDTPLDLLAVRHRDWHLAVRRAVAVNALCLWPQSGGGT